LAGNMSEPDTSTDVGLGVDLAPLANGSAEVISVKPNGRAAVAGGCSGQLWRKIKGELAGAVPAKLAGGTLRLTYPITVDLDDGSTLIIHDVGPEQIKSTTPTTLEALVLQSLPNGKPSRTPAASADAISPNSAAEIETPTAGEDDDTFICRQHGDLRIVHGSSPAQTRAQSNRARLGLPPRSEALDKFIADQGVDRRGPGCAIAPYQGIHAMYADLL
jgi:hypothetical protein